MRILASILVLTAAGLAAQAQTSPSSSGKPAPDSLRVALNRYCVTCHNQRLKTAGLTFDAIDAVNVGEHAELWEKVLRKVESGAMPPAGAPRPDATAARVLTVGLAADLDRAAANAPNPGRAPAVHRLSRTEYGNVIRDVLAVQDLPQKMELRMLLPEDNTASGFDNIADLLFVSPTTMERYLSAATKVSLLAIGDLDHPIIDTDGFGLAAGQRQDRQVDDFPAGTRGGAVARTYIPLSGEYLLTIQLGGPLLDPEELEVSVDDQRVHLFKQTQPWTSAWWSAGYGNPGQRFDVRLPIQAGDRKIAVTFVQPPLTLGEEVVQKRERSGGRFEKVLTGERQRPSIRRVTLSRPSSAVMPEHTPARDRIFVCWPSETVQERVCAKRIFSTLARRAYRRPVSEQDIQTLMLFYEAGRADGGFENGIERGVERILVSPQFLFRVESAPPGAAPGAMYRVKDLDLASRLSFFLWSSIPDETLLSLAEKGRLKDPTVLGQQVDRMLADPRAQSLVTNFAEQWLYLRDVDSKIMDDVLFPNFDEGLRRSMRRETELFLESVLLENHSALDLLRANYTFLNERLARHYGIPNVFGSHFRKVTFSADDPRGGLLGQGSVLTLTSYGTRTSPVVRGKWILENLLAAPPPPPPPNIPALAEKATDGRVLSLREAMEQHRRNPACASCHARMDPLGFALENFNAVGAWQTRAGDGAALNVSGVMPDGTKFDGLPGLRRVLVDTKSQAFVTAMTEQLLKYALGRDLSYADGPAVRKIVRDAAADDYRFYTLVRGVVASLPFQNRRAPSETAVPATTAARR
jgi:hypothetical protein